MPRLHNLSFLTVRHQFVLLMMMMASTLIIGYTVFTYQNEKAEYARESIEELVTLSRALNNDYAKLILMGLPSTGIEVRYKWRSFPMIEHADLDDMEAHSVLHYSKSDGHHRDINTGQHQEFTVVDGQWLYKFDVIFDGAKVGVARYVVSNKKYELLLEELYERFIISIPIALGLSILLSLLLQRIFVCPLRNLMAAIKTITDKQDYSACITVDEKDRSEFASLANNFNALLSRVNSSLQEVHDSKAYAQELAYNDELTGLPNRRLLTERMEYILDISKREGRHGALLFIDLDHFKTLNDSRGHAAGDDLLKQVARSLKKVFRSEDTIARLGGDEFVILSGDLEESEELVINQIHSLMLKLQYVLGENFQVEGETYHLTASIGITTFPGMANSPAELMKQADTAMYKAKEAGRDGYRFYEPEMQAAADARLQIENELRQAIETDEFELFYQPQVDEFGRILGAEALLRWFKKDGRVVSPAEFIPVAEVTGLIVSIGDWVIQQGFRQSKKWETEGVKKGFRLSINISPYQFHQSDFVARIKEILNETGATASNLTLEVTEGIIIVDIQSTIDKMHALTDIGFKISMDDFGTGYSSLMYLKKLPLSELKVDQSFVRDLHTDRSGAVIAATIIGMARSLNLEVVAEGVEEESQLRLLIRNGCLIFQGYYFHKPMSVEDFDELLLGNLVIL